VGQTPTVSSCLSAAFSARAARPAAAIGSTTTPDSAVRPERALLLERTGGRVFAVDPEPAFQNDLPVRCRCLISWCLISRFAISRCAMNGPAPPGCRAAPSSGSPHPSTGRRTGYFEATTGFATTERHFSNSCSSASVYSSADFDGFPWKPAAAELPFPYPVVTAMNFISSNATSSRLFSASFAAFGASAAGLVSSDK
jgi:hypothetical protein